MNRRACLATLTLRTTLFTVVAVVAASSAQAAPIFSSTVYASVTAFPSVVSDEDLVSIDGTTVLGPVSVSITDPVSGATGSASASIENGVLRANATSDGGAGSNGFAFFLDTLVLTTDTLAVGTPVQLSLKLQFSRTLSGDCPVDVGGGGALAFIGTPFGSVTVTEDVCDGVSMNLPPHLLDATIGTEFQLNAELLTSTSAAGNAKAVDAAVRWFLTPMGDFTYQTASGLSYIAQDPGTGGEVPEPTSLSLLGLGLAGMGARRWRQRKTT